MSALFSLKRKPTEPPVQPVDPTMLNRMQSMSVGATHQPVPPQVQPQLSQTSGDKSLLHSLLARAAPAARQAVQADSSLAEAERVLADLRATFPSLVQIVTANTSIYAALADNNRQFVAMVQGVFGDVDPARSVLREADHAAFRLRLLDGVDSPMWAMRHDAKAALDNLCVRIEMLAATHAQRVKFSRDSAYFGQKLRAMDGTPANDRSSAKKAQLTEKLAWIEHHLAQVTHKFYEDIKAVFQDRAVVTDKLVRSFVETQAYHLHSFTMAKANVKKHKIGERHMVGTAPTAPPHLQAMPSTAPSAGMAAYHSFNSSTPSSSPYQQHTNQPGSVYSTMPAMHGPQHLPGVTHAPAPSMQPQQHPQQYQQQQHPQHHVQHPQQLHHQQSHAPPGSMYASSLAYQPQQYHRGQQPGAGNLADASCNYVPPPTEGDTSYTPIPAPVPSSPLAPGSAHYVPPPDRDTYSVGLGSEMYAGLHSEVTPPPPITSQYLACAALAESSRCSDDAALGQTADEFAPPPDELAPRVDEHVPPADERPPRPVEIAAPRDK
jgi:hypothetical protein